MSANTTRALLSIVVTGIGLGVACSDGNDGFNGAAGANGANGSNGTGASGANGQNGQGGANGTNGKDGASTSSAKLGGNLVRPPGVDPSTPLSSVVALSLTSDEGTGAKDIPAFVAKLTLQFAQAKLTDGAVQFPIVAASTDTLRALKGLSPSVVAKWLDPLGFGAGAARFGANSDYIAFFGDQWNANAADPPQWKGKSDAGWIWVNHEYVSGISPTTTTAASSQMLVLSKLLAWQGMVAPSVAPGAGLTPTELDTFLVQEKRQLGGSWMRIVQDPATAVWSVDLNAANVRYDATSATLTKVTGTTISGLDHTDDGAALPANVVAGIQGDCAGGQTPWGTILTAEENVQDYYGDVEACWDANQKLIAGSGCDAGGNIAFVTAPSTSAELGRHSNPNQRHARDFYGYVVEMDPGKAPGEYEGKTSAGVGHKKLGALGRARWESATFAVGPDWRLVAGKPIVLYAGDDRRGGRIYKFVSDKPWTSDMTRAQTRALLDSGKLYVAHFAGLDNADGLKMKATGAPPTETARGQGKWILLDVGNTVDEAPNAVAAGRPGLKVGPALKSLTHNRLGGFATNDEVRRGLFTASAKLGVMELNRPEDVEWNPKSPYGKPQLFVAFTNHGRKTQLDENGLVYDPALHGTASPVRPDRVGAMFVLEEVESASPGTSMTFSFFQAWNGSLGAGTFDAGDIDNIVIDKNGGVWFGTDGNFGTNKHADALYYLDLDPTHKTGQPGIVIGSYGRAFRILAAPSDAELTGPAFSSDMRTLFVSIQHPGEDAFSVWP